jgi:hypothetical protein
MPHNAKQTALSAKRTRTFFLVLSLFTLHSSLFTFPARAQDTLPLTVAPAKQEILVDPGEKTGLSIKFLNRGDSPVSGLIRVTDFIVEDSAGTPLFLEDLGEGSQIPVVTGRGLVTAKYSAAAWTSLPYERITIPAKDKVSVLVNLTVPADAIPGGRYFAVYFEPSGNIEEGSGAAQEAASPIAIRLAGLVYLRVNGPVTENARVVRLEAPAFSEYGPIPIEAEILNLGNYHITPKGKVTLYDLFGREVVSQPLAEQNIFPEAGRLYTASIGSKWMFGKYKVELSAGYGETGQALRTTVFTWVFPWKATLAVLLAILIAVLLTAILIHRLGRRRRELEAKLAAEEKELETLRQQIKHK